MPASDDKRQQMLDLARRWRDSGIKSARAFAKERGVTPWVLYYWRQRLTEQERPKRQRPSACVSLARVRVVPEGAEAGGDLEIVLVGGDRIRLTAGVSVERLRDVVQILRTAC